MDQAGEEDLLETSLQACKKLFKMLRTNPFKEAAINNRTHNWFRVLVAGNCDFGYSSIGFHIN